MSRAIVLPFVWAMAPIRSIRRKIVNPNLELYREYTEAMLGRYMRLSLESGRVSSVIGKDLFPGYVTSCKVSNFDDVVIFVHDVERCLLKLETEEQRVIARIALQRHSRRDTARMMHLSLRSVQRRYDEAIDRLSSIFLGVKMLEPLISCQGADDEDRGLTC